MQYKQQKASETKLKETVQDEAGVDAGGNLVATSELAMAEAPDKEPEQATVVPTTTAPPEAESAKASEQSLNVQAADFAEKQMPHVWIAASFPLFFSVSLITTNLFWLFRHLNVPYAPPLLIDFYITQLFLVSYYLFRIFCIRQSARLSAKLFKGRPIKSLIREDAATKYCKELRKHSKGDKRPKMLLAHSSPLRHVFLAN